MAPRQGRRGGGERSSAPRARGSLAAGEKHCGSAPGSGARYFFGIRFASPLLCGDGHERQTTSAFLMAEILRAQGRKVALLGTICKRIGDKVVALHLTTPGLIELYAFAKDAVDAGCTDRDGNILAFPHQGRVAASLSRADFSRTSPPIIWITTRRWRTTSQAKKLLFTKYLCEDGVAVINVDDALRPPPL